MPAAAVIPALLAYIKVVAVKKLVVGEREMRRRKGEILEKESFRSKNVWVGLSKIGHPRVTVKKS